MVGADWEKSVKTEMKRVSVSEDGVEVAVAWKLESFRAMDEVEEAEALCLLV